MPGGKSKDRKLTLPYQAKINSAYQKHEFKTTFEEAFKKKQAVEHENGAVLHNTPFQCCHMPNFIKDVQFLEGLKEELLEQIFYEKNNDLYKFQQTDDLKKISSPHVKCIRKLLNEDFLDWMKDVTGIPFNNRVDLTCSRYDYTDVLLCHDDELDTRRVAFILYLVPQWSQDDGGTLDLYNMDGNGQPKDIVKSLVPTWNSFVWFEVTEASFHQVSEVLNPDKTRLSINGWFHSPQVPRPERFQPPPLSLQPYLATEEDIVSEWINPIYLDPEVQGQIQEKFENDSEIELQGFIRDEKYQEVLDALQNENTKWVMSGPPNKRHYHHLPDSDLPTIIRDCLSFLKSEEMFLTLSNLTGLTLHPLAAEHQSETGSNSEEDTTGTEQSEQVSTPGGDSIQDKHICDIPEGSTAHRSRSSKRQKLDSESEQRDDKESSSKEENEMQNTDKGEPRCYSEVRRWDHGSYTMLLDTDTEHSDYSLDAFLFCRCKGWMQEFGGYMSYITKGEDEELLTVIPSDNSLALVYREPQTLRFVKHINHKSQTNQTSTSFYDLSVVYYE